MVLLPLSVLGFGLTVTALQRDKRQYGRKQAPAAVADEGKDAVSDADSLPTVSVVVHPPTPLSYLPAGFPKSTADAYAVVEGEPLPLHSQVLAMQSSVLRDVFLTHQESGQQGAANLSLLFSGHTQLEVGLLLRWMYSPQLATVDALAEQHTSLPAVMRLADKLGASGLVQTLSKYYVADDSPAGPGELLDFVCMAERCSLRGLHTQGLEALSQRLKMTADPWGPSAAAAELAACGAEPLLGLLSGLLEGHPPGGPRRAAEVLELAEQQQPGGSFGFTWALRGFSERQGEVVSPWVTLAGRQWRLSAFPQGNGSGAGTHLSVFLYCNMAGAGPELKLDPQASITILDQLGPGIFSSSSEEGEEEEGAGLRRELLDGSREFASDNEHWGRNQFVALEELRRRDRGYLLEDRLVMRVEISLREPVGGGLAPPMTPLAVDPAQPELYTILYLLYPMFNPAGSLESVDGGLAPPVTPLAVDPHQPELCYMPAFFSGPQLADAALSIGGVALPLHSQLLAMRVGACHRAVLCCAVAGSGSASEEAEEEQGEDVEGRPWGPELRDQVERTLRACCAGYSLCQVAAFLRLVYAPELLVPHQLRALEAHLPALLRLGHATDTRWLLDGLEAYIAGKAAYPTASTPEGRYPTAGTLDLWRWAAATSTCRTSDATLSSRCLRAAAQQLLPLGPSWRAAVPRCELEAHPALAARLLGGILATSCPAGGVYNAYNGEGGAVGGLTWAIPGFSAATRVVRSPWVNIGGERWQMAVHPRGHAGGTGTHLSVFCHRDVNTSSEAGAGAGAKAVPACVELRAVDQSGRGLDSQAVQTKPDLYSAEVSNWGRPKFMALEELQRADRRYLLNDCLALHVELRLGGA
ncbi:hypothetical protein N2152v2_011310 [Parachlorella kessleri]